MDITYNADGEKLYVSPSLVMEIWPVLSPLQGGGAVQQQGGALPGGDPGPGTGTAPFDDPAIQDLSTRYCGNVVFERGEIARVLTDEGYITFAPNGKPMRHYYLRDHLGNIRVVFNQTGTVEQRNDYYPSGALMATSTGGSVQPYKYNGKELERMNGLDLYDYGARWMDSKIGARFTTMDPMCEKYYDISPYAYCAGNPVNLVDPDGRDYTVYVDKEYGTIQISAFYYCSAEDYNRCLEDCNYWNQQSGNYSAGNYIVNFSLTPIIVSNSIENISIEEDNLTIISDLLSDKQALNYTLNNDYLTDSNSYQIVNNLGKDESGNTVNGKAISGRVILVGSSNTQTGKHEIGHSLGIGHHNIGIMTPASSDANRNDQISHSYIKEILKGSLPEKGVPGAGKGHLIINGFGFDVKVFDRIKKTGL